MKLPRIGLPLIASIALALAGCASGSSIVTGTARAPIEPAQVKVYLDPPASYEVIGLVSASSEEGWTEQDMTDGAVKELKKQAAKIGANGVILLSSGTSSETVVGKDYAITSDAKTLQGKAVFVNGP